MKRSCLTEELSRGDIDSPEKIRLLVDSFYARVREDEILGPIFEHFITDWEAHLPTMYRFWERLLFGTGDYSGNPFQKHVALPVDTEDFDTWVRIFTETVDEHFEGRTAERAKSLARNISETFQARMGLKPADFQYSVSHYSRQGVQGA